MANTITLYEKLSAFTVADDKNESFEYFFKKFEPILSKYARLLGESDYKYLLSEALYDAMLKIPLEHERFRQDKYIIGYLQKSIHNEYIKISRFNSGLRNMDNIDDCICLNSPDDIFSDVWYTQLLMEINAILSTKEWTYFTMKFIEGYTDLELANMFGISRQAVNKQIRNIKHKIARIAGNISI